MQIIRLMLTLGILLSCQSCAVISREIRKESLPPTPLKTLLADTPKYIGSTVILGGYIITSENKGETTDIWVLQTPLTVGQNPVLKYRSEGRFVISHQGYLDPEVYGKDQRVTVAGFITGVRQGENSRCVVPCLEIESREIYLWPAYNQRADNLYTDPFFFPYYGIPWHWSIQHNHDHPPVFRDPFWYPQWYPSCFPCR